MAKKCCYYHKILKSGKAHIIYLCVNFGQPCGKTPKGYTYWGSNTADSCDKCKDGAGEAETKRTTKRVVRKSRPTRKRR